MFVDLFVDKKVDREDTKQLPQLEGITQLPDCAGRGCGVKHLLGKLAGQGTVGLSVDFFETGDDAMVAIRSKLKAEGGSG
jgi:hypothetical protein